MNEKLLLDFFTGKIRAQVLAEALDGAIDAGSTSTSYTVTDMTEDFWVTPHHLGMVCDAFLEGKLTADHLKAIGFILIASDNFLWDGTDQQGERVTAVANEWATPEINYPITMENVAKWKTYLASSS
ncbi:MAG TPA: hypothetical protein VF789_29415 [Thermoanaerobaculia bacterium]